MIFKFLIGKSYFVDDGSQNFSIFQLIFNTFTKEGGAAEAIVVQEFESCQMKKIKPPMTLNDIRSLELKWHNSNKRVELEKGRLK